MAQIENCGEPLTFQKHYGKLAYSHKTIVVFLKHNFNLQQYDENGKT
jgi:hypothetical protein